MQVYNAVKVHDKHVESRSVVVVARAYLQFLKAR